MQDRRQSISDPAKNRRVAIAAGAVSFGMLCLAYASVPLYRLFCQATGFGGTTQVAASAPANAGTQEITIRFDANVDAALGWTFHPKDQRVKVRTGQSTMAFYVASNNRPETMTGSAVFNVTPAEAGAFFNKIECFCFSQQTLKSGETVEMPVQFFIDPAIATDPDTRSIREITLSYTFYPVTKSAAGQPAITRTN